MRKIKTIIIDDEPLALDLLERYVERTPFLQLLCRYSSAVEALEMLNQQQPDLIFLDIQMPELNGIEFSRLVPKETKIIFTTAFNDYALEGYRVNALDYLLKPFNYEEFLRSACKAKEWFDLSNRTVQRHTSPTEEAFIFVKSEYKQVKVYLDKVIYFEGLKDYVKIWMDGEHKPLLTIISLKALNEELPADKFMRVHRSYIIALHKIQALERSQAIMTNGERITIADQYKEKFQEFIDSKSIS